MDAVEPEPFASLLKGDLKGAFAGGEPAIAQLLMQTHAGMTTDEFNAIVTDWIATARHPKTGRLYTEMVYQPMLELLAYLRANGFKTFIVSGGGIEFLRPWAEKVYGIPPEQVIGSSIKTTFDRETPRRNTVSWQHSSTPEDSFSGDKGRPVAEHVDLRRFEAPDELRIFEKHGSGFVREKQV